ncbi:MAG: hypothetical protein U0230_25040 [Polyangiales bacterium]
MAVGGNCIVVATDQPDASFTDSDGDGIDGTASAAVFVAIDGDDANAGTRSAPVRTLARGMSLATSGGRSLLLVGTGTYAETLLLVPGIGVHGGYIRANGWARSASDKTIVRGAGVGLRSLHLTAPTRISFLEVEATNAPVGESSIAGIVSDSSALVIEDSSFVAGDGGDGAAGTQPATPAKAAAGQAGSPGLLRPLDAAAPAVCQNAAPQGGTGGGSGECRGGTGGSTSATGFAHVSSGTRAYESTGSPGETPTCPGAPVGTGGLGGQFYLSTVSSNFWYVQMAGQVGLDGLPGAPGADGSAVALGVFSSTGFAAASGLQGATGQRGGGGGGGGAGSAQGGGFTDLDLYPIPLPTASHDHCFMSGASGGGGGEGGYGGPGGPGGGGGGASVALLVLDGSVTLTRVSLSAGHAGDGGAGALGALGGDGGDFGGGGSAGSEVSGTRTVSWQGSNVTVSNPEVRFGSPSGPFYPHSNPPSYIASGGRGGYGGKGGKGGAGAGGSGGPSVALVLGSTASLAPSSTAVSYDMTRAAAGTAGTGGGASNAGAAGLVAMRASLGADGRIASTQ